MAKSLQRLRQIAKPDSFDDQRDSVDIANSEINSEDLGQFVEAFLSQIKRLIHGNESGNWFDDPASVFGGDASLFSFFGLAYHQVACLSSDTVGDFVCIRGERVNGKWRVEKANPEDQTKMPSVGVLVSKSTPTVGIMQLVGPCTLFTGLDFTKPAYHLWSSGIQSGLPPIGPGGYVMVQQVGKPVSSDILWLSNDTRMVKQR